MSDSLMIKNASDDDDDAYVITNLAREWGARLPYLAELKLFKDGREMVDANSVPQGTDPNAAPVYKLMRQLGVVNLARRISESVTDRQQPNGFRKVEDSSLKDTDADRMAKQCGLNFILRRNMLPDKGDYGCSFGLVSNAGRGRFITPLSPWECWMDVGETAAIQYTYLDRENKEVIRLYRLVVDDSKTTTKVYSKTAQREHDRSVVDPNDVSSVAKFASDAKAWEPGSDWEWAEDSQASDFSYAEGCDSLPIVRLSTVDGQGLFEPYLPMLKRIDRETFDRLCITMMQAFRQRAIKGTVPTTYTEEDQEVIDGDKQAGDPIDLASTFAVGPAALWKLPDGVDI